MQPLQRNAEVAFEPAGLAANATTTKECHCDAEHPKEVALGLFAANGAAAIDATFGTIAVVPAAFHGTVFGRATSVFYVEVGVDKVFCVDIDSSG